MSYGPAHEYGLREDCRRQCVAGPWPSFLDMVPPPNGPITDEAGWRALDKLELTVELEAKKGDRFEIWVTAVGRLRTRARRSTLGPCDRIGSELYGYGHLGGSPAELVVGRFSDLQVKRNPTSPFDYSKMYRGPS